MDKNKFAHALGLARRAGKLGLGHDAVKEAVRRGRARCVVFSADASQRLRGEITALSGDDVTVLHTELTTEDIAAAVGKRAAVVSVNDEGLSVLVKSAYMV